MSSHYRKLQKFEYFTIFERDHNIYIRKAGRIWAKLDLIKKEWSTQATLQDINNLSDDEFSEWFMLIKDRVAKRYC